MGSLLLSSIILVITCGKCYACSGIFTLQSGFIESPRDSQGYYPNSANCTYTIRGGSSAHYVHFIFQRFLMESCCDFLYIGNQRFNGNHTGFGNTYYFDNHITLHFTSDGSVHNYPGFRVSYRIIPDSFSYDFTTLSGIIESPIGRNSSYYPDYAGYVYNIIGSSHVHYIQFEFEKFELEKKYDYLFIGSHNFTGIHTGYETEYANNNTINLVFTSDGSNHNYAGFRIRYSMITECKNGSYGLNCTSKCRYGCVDVCNKNTGSCRCKPGWTNRNCEAACPSGTYDSYCTKSCSPGCVDGSCDKEDGSCSCKPGYMGQWCNQTCPSGTYDSYCTKSCSPGCVDESCDKEDGSCSCKPGYTGEWCNQTCPSGTYDSYCTKSCSSGCVDGSCNKVDGNCSYKSENTNASEAGLQATTNLKLIVGVTGGSVAFVLLLIIVNIIYCCACIRRRKTMNEDINRTPDVNEMRTVPSGMKQTAAFEQPIYDNPIAEKEQGNRDCYESLQYSGDQRPGISQSVPHVSGSKDDDSLYVNVPMQTKKKKKKKKSGYIEGEQCYVNHAIHT